MANSGKTYINPADANTQNKNSTTPQMDCVKQLSAVAKCFGEYVGIAIGGVR
jgi:hypothetical protein